METVRINGQDYTSSLSDAEIAFMGNFSLPTTAQTLSGAIAEHENDISELNSNLGILRAKYYTVASTVTVQKTALSNILLQAYNDIAGETLVNVFCFTWEATNSGCGMISPDRRFIILCGGTLFFGVIRTDGTFTSYRQASYTEP